MHKIAEDVKFATLTCEGLGFITLGIRLSNFCSIAIVLDNNKIIYYTGK